LEKRLEISLTDQKFWCARESEREREKTAGEREREKEERAGESEERRGFCNADKWERKRSLWPLLAIMRCHVRLIRFALIRKMKWKIPFIYVFI
jgi:hypothetical protein